MTDNQELTEAFQQALIDAETEEESRHYQEAIERQKLKKIGKEN